MKKTKNFRSLMLAVIIQLQREIQQQKQEEKNEHPVSNHS